MTKYAINLLQPELVIAQPLLSLKRLVIAWGAGAVVILCLALWAQLQLYQLGQNKAELSKTQKSQQRELAALQSRITKNIADPSLLSKLALVKVITANKRALQQQLTDTSKTYAAGFSSAMTQLSQQHHQDIHLQRINISANQITFAGLARSGDAVPSWLAGFTQSELLSGKRFIGFSLKEDPQQLIEFIVSTAEIVEEEVTQQ